MVTLQVNRTPKGLPSRLFADDHGLLLVLLLLLLVDVLDVVPQRALREELHVAPELGAVHVLVSNLGEPEGFI